MNLNSTHQWTQVADVYSLLVWSSQTKQVIFGRMAKQLGPVNMTKLTLVSVDRITFWYSHVKFYHYFVNPKWFSFLKMNKTAKQPSNDYLTWPDCLKLILNVLYFFSWFQNGIKHQNQMKTDKVVIFIFHFFKLAFKSSILVG